MKEKKVIKQNELKSLLTDWKVDMDFSERFIINQANTTQLVHKDCLSMLDFLEELIGTVHYKEQLKEEENEIRTVFSELNHLRSTQVCLENEQHKLVDAVNTYNKYKDAYSECQKLELKLLEEHHLLKILECYKVETEKNALANQIQQFVQNKTEFQGRIAVFQEKSGKKSEKLKKWKEKETNLLKKIEVEKEDEIRLTTRATKFEQDIIESQKEISNLQTEIKDLQSSLQDAVAQIAEKERIIEDLLQQQRAFQVKKNEIENELSNKFPELTNKLKLLLQKLTLLEKHEILYSATANSANQKTKELVTILNDLKSQITERDKLYQNCKADWEALVKEQNVRITAIEEINKEIEFFHQKRQVIENELDRHRKRLISIQSYLKKLHSQQTVSVFEKTIRELQSKSTSHDISIIGMLKDLLYVLQPKYLEAVNSILRPYFHHTVVVKTREDAKKLVAYFCQYKLGVVSCEILSELHDVVTSLPERVPQCLQWVPQLIECNDPSLRPLVVKLAGKWWLAETREIAANLSYDPKTQQRRNIVTLQGELYYAHGEITLIKTKNRSHDLVTTQNQVSTTYSLAQSNTIKYQPEDERLAQQQIVQLEQEHDMLLIKTESLHRTLQTKEFELSSLKEKTKESHSLLLELEQEIKTKRELLATTENHLQELQLAKQPNSHLSHKYNALHQKLETYLNEHPQLKPLREVERQLQSITSKIVEEQQSHEVFIQTQKNLHETLLAKQNRCEFLQNEVHSLQQKLTQIRNEIKRKTKKTQKLVKQHHTLTNTIQKLNEALTSLQNTLETLEKDAHSCEKELTTFQENFKRLENELLALRSAKEQIELQLVNGMSDSSLKSSKQSHFQSSPKSLLNVGKKIDKVQRKMRQIKLELEYQQQKVEELLLAFDMRDVERYQKLQDDLKQLFIQIRTNEERLESMKKKKLDLEVKRYTEFKNGMQKINQTLQRVYQQLTIHGDCYLGYTDETRGLFEQGVWFQVRPDKTSWRPFLELSGGQKALAALALSLSFNVCYPSAIHIFDEIDASLDSRMVERVARFISELNKETNSQFFIVSHRYQFYQFAKTIVGVYKFHNESRIAIFRLEQQQQQNTSTDVH